MFPTLQAEEKVENEEVKEQNTQELGFPDLSFPTWIEQVGRITPPFPSKNRT